MANRTKSALMDCLRIAFNAGWEARDKQALNQLTKEDGRFLCLGPIMLLVQDVNIGDLEKTMRELKLSETEEDIFNWEKN